MNEIACEVKEVELSHILAIGSPSMSQVKSLTCVLLQASIAPVSDELMATLLETL
jgi:hypothetical protein